MKSDSAASAQSKMSKDQANGDGHKDNFAKVEQVVKRAETGKKRSKRNSGNEGKGRGPESRGAQQLVTAAENVAEPELTENELKGLAAIGSLSANGVFTSFAEALRSLRVADRLQSKRTDALEQEVQAMKVVFERNLKEMKVLKMLNEQFSKEVKELKTTNQGYQERIQKLETQLWTVNEQKAVEIKELKMEMTQNQKVKKTYSAMVKASAPRRGMVLDEKAEKRKKEYEELEKQKAAFRDKALQYEGNEFQTRKKEYLKFCEKMQPRQKALEEERKQERENEKKKRKEEKEKWDNERPR